MHNNSNKGLTLVRSKHFVNCESFCQTRKALQFLPSGSYSCRGLVFLLTKHLVLLHYSIINFNLLKAVNMCRFLQAVVPEKGALTSYGLDINAHHRPLIDFDMSEPDRDHISRSFNRSEIADLCH